MANINVQGKDLTTGQTRPVTTNDTITNEDGSAITAGVDVAKNSAAATGTRPELNFIEGTNVTLTIADDSGNNRVNITITAAGAGLSTVSAQSDAGSATGTASSIVGSTTNPDLGVAAFGRSTNSFSVAIHTIPSAGSRSLTFVSGTSSTFSQTLYFTDGTATVTPNSFGPTGAWTVDVSTGSVNYAAGWVGIS